MANKKDLTGLRFGRLVAKEEVGKNKHGRPIWKCKCDCGKIIFADSNRLQSLNTKSCGCLKLETISNLNKSHGESKTKLYRVWQGIISRCQNKNNVEFQNYGGRGISICDEWRESFNCFREWANESGYKEGLTIDRIDNNGNYEPDNCRWVTSKEQARNTTKNIIFEHNGERYILKDLAHAFGINYNTLYNRLFSYKWDLNKAISTPIRRNKYAT